MIDCFDVCEIGLKYKNSNADKSEAKVNDSMG